VQLAEKSAEAQLWAETQGVRKGVFALEGREGLTDRKEDDEER